MNYEQIQSSFNQTFADDYHFVGHPELAPVSPFEPNIERRYNLTHLPSKQEWYSRMGGIKKIMLACMDQDVSPRIYRYEDRAVITMAGGIVQEEDSDREKVLQDLIGLLSYDISAGRYEKLEKISVSGHNNTCGYVGVAVGEKLPNLLGCNPRAEQETECMQRLIANGAKRILAPLFESVSEQIKINVGIFDTCRSDNDQPSSFIKFDHTQVQPLGISDLRSLRAASQPQATA